MRPIAGVTVTLTEPIVFTLAQAARRTGSIAPVVLGEVSIAINEPPGTGGVMQDNVAFYQISYTGNLAGLETGSVTVSFVGLNRTAVPAASNGTDLTRLLSAALTSAATNANVLAVTNDDGSVTLTFEAGDPTGLVFSLTTMDDSIVEGIKDLDVIVTAPTLADSTNSAAIGHAAVTTQIVDNEALSTSAPKTFEVLSNAEKATLTDDLDSDKSDVLEGGLGNDVLLAGGGDDILIGGDGIDFLSGGDGDDLLLGRFGSDEMIGGVGNTFTVDAGSLGPVNDLIADYDYTEGDVLDLTEILGGLGLTNASDLDAAGYVKVTALTASEYKIEADKDGIAGGAHGLQEAATATVTSGTKISFLFDDLQVVRDVDL